VGLFVVVVGACSPVSRAPWVSVRATTPARHPTAFRDTTPAPTHALGSPLRSPANAPRLSRLDGSRHRVVAAACFASAPSGSRAVSSCDCVGGLTVEDVSMHALASRSWVSSATDADGGHGRVRDAGERVGDLAVRVRVVASRPPWSTWKVRCSSVGGCRTETARCNRGRRPTRAVTRRMNVIQVRPARRQQSAPTHGTTSESISPCPLHETGGNTTRTVIGTEHDPCSFDSGDRRRRCR